MDYSPEEYSRYYIVEALFKLMSAYEYGKITVTDIARRAGVGRATFYRYFKSKEDVIIYYFEHNTKKFVYSQNFLPRCKDDYVMIAKNALNLFKVNKEPFKLLRKARLEYLYLDYLNKNFAEMFESELNNSNSYAPFIYAGMLFNVSMAWLADDCKRDVNAVAEMMVSSIYFE